MSLCDACCEWQPLLKGQLQIVGVKLIYIPGCHSQSSHEHDREAGPCRQGPMVILITSLSILGLTDEFGSALSQLQVLTLDRKQKAVVGELISTVQEKSTLP